MNVMTAGMAGILTVLLAVQLRSVKGEYALYLVLAAGILITLAALRQLSGISSLWQQWMSELPVDSVYLTVLLKMVGVAYMVQFCAGLCRDGGYSGLAVQIETFGKFAILAMGLPVISSLLEALRSFLYEGISS
jgi:stage III sporulation protein AD